VHRLQLLLELTRELAERLLPSADELELQLDERDRLVENA
jgi:hypothetical protein